MADFGLIWKYVKCIYWGVSVNTFKHLKKNAQTDIRWLLNSYKDQSVDVIAHKQCAMRFQQRWQRYAWQDTFSGFLFRCQPTNISWPRLAVMHNQWWICVSLWNICSISRCNCVPISVVVSMEINKTDCYRIFPRLYDKFDCKLWNQVCVK